MSCSAVMMGHVCSFMVCIFSCKICMQLHGLYILLQNMYAASWSVYSLAKYVCSFMVCIFSCRICMQLHGLYILLQNMYAASWSVYSLAKYVCSFMVCIFSCKICMQTHGRTWAPTYVGQETQLHAQILH